MKSSSHETVYNGMSESNQKLKTRMIVNARYFSIGRFSSFLLTIASIIAAFSLGNSWWWLTAVLLFAFVVLVVLHEGLVNRQKFNDSCISAVEDELSAIRGEYATFEDGSEFTDHAHIYTTDLDFFGNNSLFQAINRAATQAGKSRLACWLREPLIEKEKIAARQEAVKELAVLPDWRIKLRAYGILADEGKKDVEMLCEWLSSVPLFRSAIFSILTIIIPLASFVITALMVSGLVTIQIFLLYLLLPLTIIGFYIKTINQRHAMLSGKVAILEKYAIRFRMIEKMNFGSGFMINLQERLKSGNIPASKRIHELGRITASLDTRLNLLAGFVLNIYLLWDIRQMIRLEKWKSAHKLSLPEWFDAFSETEAIAGFAAFAYANPDFVFPEINSAQFAIRAVDACHPLIPAAQRVYNDISLTHHGHFNIVTGANMAGKSTYLRTIGVNMVLALAGAPVCASAFNCYPAPVFTSLRTTDSLSTNQSYFYAELLRLKALIDRLGRGEELFILLDEILKGTNSADKQAGSKALLTQLIGLGAAGFIATHDLELGNLEKSFPDDVTNYSFEAEIAGDELHFDYKLKPGIARNMNATFLMKKMGITI
jgi:hypothetical protein